MVAQPLNKMSQTVVSLEQKGHPGDPQKHERPVKTRNDMKWEEEHNAEENHLLATETIANGGMLNQTKFE